MALIRRVLLTLAGLPFLALVWTVVVLHPIVIGVLNRFQDAPMRHQV